MRDRFSDEKYTWKNLPNFREDDVVDWERYAYEVNPEKLKELLNENDPVFVSGIGNWGDCLDLFDKIFVLTMTRGTAKQRLVTHERLTHHLESEIDRMLADFEQKQQRLVDVSPRTAQIDATKSPEEILGDILAYI